MPITSPQVSHQDFAKLIPFADGQNSFEGLLVFSREGEAEAKVSWTIPFGADNRDLYIGDGEIESERYKAGQPRLQFLDFDFTKS